MDFEKIKDEAIRYFALLYKKDGREKPLIPNLFSSRNDSKVTPKLEMPFLVEEVKNAIMSMEKNKSPEPDGFSMLFYQECWDIIEEDLMAVLDEFFERGNMQRD